MNTQQVDLSKYQNKLGLKNKMQRLLWRCACLFFFRPFFPGILMPWRRLVLRFFGAKMGKGAVVHASVRIWAPWNLEMGEFSCLAGDVDCYNVDKVVVGSHTTVSQKSYICTASHDVTHPGTLLSRRPFSLKTRHGLPQTPLSAWESASDRELSSAPGLPFSATSPRGQSWAATRPAS